MDETHIQVKVSCEVICEPGIPQTIIASEIAKALIKTALITTRRHFDDDDAYNAACLMLAMYIITAKDKITKEDIAEAEGRSQEDEIGAVVGSA